MHSKSKLFISILLSSFLFIPSLFANIVSVDNAFIAGDQYSADFHSRLNRNFVQVEDGENNITTSQIVDGTLKELDMNDEINPRIRTNEGAACEFVYSGLLPVTSASLSTTIGSGTAYPRGYRINKASTTAHSYTASKWTFTDLDINGNFQYSEVAINAATPAVATNSIRLARVSTDGTTVNSVQDLRKTSCATGPFSAIGDATGEGTLASMLSSGKPLSVSNDVGFVQGLRVSWDTVTTFKVTAGSAYINGKYRAMSTDTTVPQTADNPALGVSGLDTGAIAASTKYNVFAVADQDAVPGFSISYGTGTSPNGVTNARKIGEIFTDATSLFTSKDLMVTSALDEKQLVGGFVNFNGSGVARIYNEYNVSSVSYVAAGRYRVNWNNTFVSGDQYVATCTSGGNPGNPNSVCQNDNQSSEPSGSSFGVRVTNSAGTEGDENALHVEVIASGVKNK